MIGIETVQLLQLRQEGPRRLGINLSEDDLWLGGEHLLDLGAVRRLVECQTLTLSTILPPSLDHAFTSDGTSDCEPALVVAEDWPQRG